MTMTLLPGTISQKSARYYRVAKTHRIPYLYRPFFRKSDLYLVALLWKMICNLGDPMSLRHPVRRQYEIITELIVLEEILKTDFSPKLTVRT